MAGLGLAGLLFLALELSAEPFCSMFLVHPLWTPSCLVITAFKSIFTHQPTSLHTVEVPSNSVYNPCFQSALTVTALHTYLSYTSKKVKDFILLSLILSWSSSLCDPCFWPLPFSFCLKNFEHFSQGRSTGDKLQHFLLVWDFVAPLFLEDNCSGYSKCFSFKLKCLTSFSLC